MVTLTWKETGSSWRIETQALQQALCTLLEKGLNIVEVIHDDNAQVDAILNQHNILSQKDLWHKCKNVTGKFKELLQEKRRTPRTRRGDTTPELLTMDIHNAADHWAGDHSTCRNLPGVRKCIVENWSGEQNHKYAPSGETHKAVKEFLKKYITESKMRCYIRARENFISKTFHSVINKYATKRIHFDSSHTTRLACAAMDWNENIRRDVRTIYQRSSNDTAVRRKAKTNRYLANRTSCWKRAFGRRVFG
ncbi:hypothetical protein R1flu_018354 [Riccia fluitans]|uniref:Transposase n=1 Tax=Riccia fluitans TaxID=41844 RepID=A0ABD1ZHV0_9MARC